MGVRTARRAPAAGFTLLEILVVLFIMALLSGVVVLALPNAAEPAEREAQRFAARLQMAAQESVITGEAWGVAIEPDEYGFYRRRAGVWTPVGARDEFFAPMAWDRATIVTVERDGAPVRRADDEDRRPEAPVIRFDATGEATPAEVLIERDGRFFVVRVTPLGEIQFESGRT